MFMDRILCNFSLLIKKHIDTVCCFYFIGWLWASYQFFFHEHDFYYPNAVVITHYLDVSFAGWVVLFSHYHSMKLAGKITVLAFTVLEMLNIYQIHVQFKERHYFVLWISVIFLCMALIYIFFIVAYIRLIFKNHKTKNGTIPTKLF